MILWHPYDRWGFAEMSDPQDDRYLRYCIARLSAYRNVWWSLANEYDFMTDQPPGHRGNKQMEDWDRFFQILQKEDPYGRMRGIHNGQIWYDHTQDWVTHASLQTSDMAGGVGYRAQYQKPVIYDECKYEGDIPQGWGNLTPRGNDAAILARHAQRLLRRPRRDLQASRRTSSGGPRAACCTAKARNASNG